MEEHEKVRCDNNTEADKFTESFWDSPLVIAPALFICGRGPLGTLESALEAKDGDATLAALKGVVNAAARGAWANGAQSKKGDWLTRVTWEEILHEAQEAFRRRANVL